MNGNFYIRNKDINENQHCKNRGARRASAHSASGNHLPPLRESPGMIGREQLALLATYNNWMNSKVYEAAARLPPTELAQDRQAFFGSILGTLNHIAVADTIWLRRFSTLSVPSAVLAQLAELPAPQALDTRLFAELEGLAAYRKRLDDLICVWVEALTEDDLHRQLRYATMKGIAANKRLGDVALHFFNHQTHHRGQVTTLLSQAGQDVGITDLIALIPDQELT